MVAFPPIYDAQGLNVADPNDSLGIKTRYITSLQTLAMQQYYPRGTGLAADIGCGYGRLTSLLGPLGYQQIVGIDPDPNLIDYARKAHPQQDYRLGGLPDLPLETNQAELLLLHNVLRPLKLIGMLERLQSLRRYLAADGQLVVVDNVWPGRSDYWEWQELVDEVQQHGFELVEWHPIRAARWWMIYAIRYGLVPSGWLQRIASYELAKMRRRSAFSRWQYINTYFLFRPIGT